MSPEKLEVGQSLTIKPKMGIIPELTKQQKMSMQRRDFGGFF